MHRYFNKSEASSLFPSRIWIVLWLWSVGLGQLYGATNQLPTWRVGGSVREWSTPLVSATPPPKESETTRGGFLLTRTVFFNLEFSEGGQWRIQTRNSMDHFVQLREAASDHGDLFELFHDANGTFMVDGAKVSFQHTGRVDSGPIRFFTTQIGAVWWLFCSRYTYQGGGVVAVPDFLDGDWSRPFFGEMTLPSAGLGLEKGAIYENDPTLDRVAPRFTIKVLKSGTFGSISAPAAIRMQEFSTRTQAGLAVHEINCTNLVAIPRPADFRPGLPGLTGIMDQRFPMWRLSYASSNWVERADLEKRLETERGVKAEFLGRPIAPPRSARDIPIF